MDVMYNIIYYIIKYILYSRIIKVIRRDQKQSVNTTD